MTSQTSKMIAALTFGTLLAAATFWHAHKTLEGSDESEEPNLGAERIITGRVLGPDGKPFAGATIALGSGHCRETFRTDDVATTDMDGKFRCVAPAVKAGKGDARMVVARATDLSADWIRVRELNSPDEDIELRLTARTSPVRGRVLTRNGGSAIEGATVRLVAVSAPDKNSSLKDVYDAQREDSYLGTMEMKKILPQPAAAGLPTQITADKNGRFEIAGIAEGWLLTLEITQESIEQSQVHVAVDRNFNADAIKPALDKNKDLADLRLKTKLAGPPPLYGPTFDHAARACRPIAGTVVDRQSGRPIAGVTIEGQVKGQLRGTSPSARTDAAGRFTLLGLPDSECDVSFEHKEKGSPFLRVKRTVKATGDLNPVSIDMSMIRGTVVTGRVTDAKSGRPIRGHANYEPLLGNTAFSEHLGKDVQLGRLTFNEIDNDGRFRIVVPSGPGIVTIDGSPCDDAQRPYPRVKIRTEDKDKPYVKSGRYIGESFRTADDHSVFLIIAIEYRVIAPALNQQNLSLDLKIDPGQSATVDVIDADGRPVSGAMVFGTTPISSRSFVAKGNSFSVRALQEGSGRPVVVVHGARKLGGIATVFADKRSSMQLAPWAALTGRIVDEAGRPMASVKVELSYRKSVIQLNPDSDDLLESQPTDHLGEFGETMSAADGMFRLDIPIAKPFRFDFKHNGKMLHGDQGGSIEVEPGSSRDIGDIRLRTKD